MNTANHFNLIYEMCEVVAEVHEPFFGLYYIDGGNGYAEFNTPSGIASYSCDSLKEFRTFCELISDDDGESNDDIDEPDDLEMGFDPYEGGYTFDC